MHKAIAIARARLVKWQGTLRQAHSKAQTERNPCRQPHKAQLSPAGHSSAGNTGWRKSSTMPLHPKKPQ